MVELMRHLGHGRFAVVGHDRGGRVAYRMALDHPGCVDRLAVLDIVPTHTLWTRLDKHGAMAMYHWMFLAQPDGLPEHMIGADRLYFLREKIKRWAVHHHRIDPRAMAEYERCFDTATIHASCEDYRAGATVDFAHDSDDFGLRKITCPVLALWGEGGFAKRGGAVLDAWRQWAEDVRGQAIACGHHLPEEAPRETTAALMAFL
jgi:haloacetate dehalogenase